MLKPKDKEELFKIILGIKNWLQQPIKLIANASLLTKILSDFLFGLYFLN
jgi:hypothetical protein